MWHWGWDAIVESDDTFRRFYGLDSIYATERVSQVYLTGQGERNYFNMTFYRFGNLTGDTFNFDTKTFEKVITATAYPVIDYNYIHDKPVLGGELSFDLNAVALTVNDPTGVSPVFRRDTDHIVTQVEWRRTLTDGMGERFTPFGQARGDVYHVSSFEDINGQSGPEDTFTREMVVGGLDYRYPFVAQTENASHVIEPVAQIIARSNVVNNDKVPNEDSQSLVFDDTLLFDINKFSGYDRLETGTRANLGGQYTMQTYNGVSVRVVGGESILIAGPNAFAAYPDSGLSTDRSDYVVGSYVDWKNMFRVVSQVRLDERDFSLQRQDYSVQTKLGFFQGAVSYVAVEPQPTAGFLTQRQEVAGFAAFRLNDDWTLFGDLRYDLELDRFIRNSVGLQYSDECFTLSVTYQQTFIQDLDIKPDTSVMVRIGLKYLGQQSVPDSIGDLSPEAAVFR
jgi:LPS-assembly protein